MLPDPVRAAATRRCVPLLCRALLLFGLWLAAGAAGPAAAAAQLPATLAPGETVYQVRLADGSTLFARVTAVEADRLVLETTAGARVEVDRDRIRTMEPARGRVVNGDFWREDPSPTRLLLLSPTGRTLPAGEGYFSSYWIVFPFIGYGVTDAFTIAGGTPLIPEVIGRVFYLAPKLRVYRQPELDLSVGTLAFFLSEDIGSGSAGILYGVGTYGQADRSISLGAGWGFAIGDGTTQLSNQPVVMLGGEARLTSRTKLLTENYVIPGEAGALLSGGLRFIGERLSVDFGFGIVPGIRDLEDVPWFPVLNFVYNFGRPR